MDKNIIERLTVLDYGIVAAYLLTLLVIGYRASFSKKKKTGEAHFLASKSLGWASVGFNMWGTNVGPSMLLAFASVGYSTGIVAINFDWYAFIFLFLLAVVFAPRYLAAKVTTMPEFMGNRYGDSTQTILAWYALIKILISWLSLGLFAGGFLVRQILGIPMWQSVTVLVLFAGGPVLHVRHAGGPVYKSRSHQFPGLPACAGTGLYTGENRTPCRVAGRGPHWYRRPSSAGTSCFAKLPTWCCGLHPIPICLIVTCFLVFFIQLF